MHLGRNCIRHVEAVRLHRARGLRYLLLQHNKLGASALPAGTLKPLQALHTLHLYGNRLERVPPALPRHLQALVMPHNRVATLGARDLASARALAELNLAYNRLASARVHPRAFRRLRALRTLDLSGNQLSRLPEGLPASLRSLRLQRNQLRTLEPEQLAGLNKLRELSLAHNRLRVGDIGPGTWHELQALQVRSLTTMWSSPSHRWPSSEPRHATECYVCSLRWLKQTLFVQLLLVPIGLLSTPPFYPMTVASRFWQPSWARALTPL